MVRERLVGFDARRPTRFHSRQWDHARRDLFLLDASVPLPLSVDTLVWPSLFDTGQGIGMQAGQRRELGFDGIPLPEDGGAAGGLWQDLSRLRHSLAGQPPGAEGIIVAITLIAEKVAPGREAAPILPDGRTASPEPDPAWRRLGYDVADGSPISGLMNCGYTPDEVFALRGEWAARLNEHHLFDDPQHALNFASLTDARVPEHAPFFVYGLYLVEMHRDTGL